MAYLGEEIRKLGFGMMRLPRLSGGQDGPIDIEQTKDMVDMFLDAGFTYFDTAWSYDGSEDAVRQALVERYPRDSYQLATKAAVWMGAKDKEEARSQLEVSLKRTGAGYFDFYLLHNLGEFRTHFFDDFGMWDFVQEKKAEGLIKHVGFSFHSTPEELETILKAHPEVEFVQLQINYADWDNPAVQSRACYEVARKYGKPVIIMEPVKGGMLANPPEAVKNILQEAEPDMSTASWAIRFAASQEGVITVLSGMSNREQVADNLSYMKTFSGLSKGEQAVIHKAQKALNEIPLIPCTSCNYCAKVCPNHVNISGTFEMMNMGTLYGVEAARHELMFMTGGGKKLPDACVKCGQCEIACPQHIPIRENLEKAVQIYL